ncbi:MAG: hypothetical protein L3J56_12325 [Bacteroidales bacterium]|nr:hypothetical protein [Bacteroidales bacterium]
MCVKLADGLNGEEVRKVLIEKYSIGLISLGNVLRVAYSAVAADNVKELFEGIYGPVKIAVRKLSVAVFSLKSKQPLQIYFEVAV